MGEQLRDLRLDIPIGDPYSITGSGNCSDIPIPAAVACSDRVLQVSDPSHLLATLSLLQPVSSVPVRVSSGSVERWPLFAENPAFFFQYRTSGTYIAPWILRHDSLGIYTSPQIPYSDFCPGLDSR